MSDFSSILRFHCLFLVGFWEYFVSLFIMVGMDSTSINNIHGAISFSNKQPESESFGSRLWSSCTICCSSCLI